MSGCSRWASSRRKTGWSLVAPKLLDVGLDGEEEVGRRGGRVQAERVAEVAVEVAASEGGVAAVGESEAGLGEVASQGAQDAGLADAGLAEQEHALALGEGLLDIGDERGLALGEPEVGVVDLLGEGRRAEAEGAEVRRGRHRHPPRSSARPGLKSTGPLARSGEGRLGGRRVLALAVGSTMRSGAVLPSSSRTGGGAVEEAGSDGDDLACEVAEGDLVQDAAEAQGRVAADAATGPDGERALELLLVDAHLVALCKHGGGGATEDAGVGRVLVEAREPGAELTWRGNT